MGDTIIHIIMRQRDHAEVEMGAAVLGVPFQDLATKRLDLIAVVLFHVHLGKEQSRHGVFLIRAIGSFDGAAEGQQSGVAVSGEEFPGAEVGPARLGGVQRLGPGQANVGVGRELVGQQHLAQLAPGECRSRLAQHPTARRRHRRRRLRVGAVQGHGRRTRRAAAATQPPPDPHRRGRRQRRQRQRRRHAPAAAGRPRAAHRPCPPATGFP